MVKFLIISLVSTIAFASTEAIDSECRIQAKEKAITTYQSCVKEARSQKIDEIRKDYQTKLQELKSYYDTEMKKMSSSAKPLERTDESPVAEITLKKKGKAAKNSGLPAKKTQGKSLPVRNIEPETVTAPLESSDTEIVNIEENAI
ncbi:MAG: hypothetical protein JNL11_07050 [Bdellovibrionaceae bacterium]|nr:hypothetical protein [Pseudobdellovibrionaceae bacterium]